MKNLLQSNGLYMVKKYLVITVACIIYGAGISLFVDPNHMAPGGFTGLAVILSKILPLETGTIYFLLNIPVIVLGVWKFGWKFAISTLYAILVATVGINSMAILGAATTEPILGAVFGGALIAVGIGLVFRNSATTGGIDIIVKCLRQKIPHLKTGTLMLIIDALIVCLSGVVFGDINSVLYSVIAVLTTSYVLDIVLYGRDEAKLIYVISDKSEEITERMLKEIELGITLLKGSGAYENKEKKIIMCVARKQSAHKVEEVVKQEDASAFMIITSATEIFGEGYKSYYGEIL